MCKKRTGCVLIVFISILGSYFFIPQLLLVIITVYLFCAILFWLNRKALKKIQDQKEPFKIGGKIRNVHYLIIGDMAKPSIMVPANQSFVQIKAPNRSLRASFEILKHTSSILDEDEGNVIRDIILEGFDSWNKGLTQYLAWVDDNFATGATSKYGDNERDMDKYKEEITKLFESETITKLYFDNFLIRDNWAAIHYRFRGVDQKNTRTRVGERMEFFKFEGTGASKKIVGNWLK